MRSGIDLEGLSDVALHGLKKEIQSVIDKRQSEKNRERLDKILSRKNNEVETDLSVDMDVDQPLTEIPASEDQS